jgi:hypothetical protein
VWAFGARLVDVARVHGTPSRRYSDDEPDGILGPSRDGHQLRGVNRPAAAWVPVLNLGRAPRHSSRPARRSLRVRVRRSHDVGDRTGSEQAARATALPLLQLAGERSASDYIDVILGPTGRTQPAFSTVPPDADLLALMPRLAKRPLYDSRATAQPAGSGRAPARSTARQRRQERPDATGFAHEIRAVSSGEVMTN